MFETKLLANVTPAVTTYNEVKHLWRDKLIKQRGEEFYNDHFLRCASEMIPLLDVVQKTKVLPEPYSLYIPTNYKEKWEHISSSSTSVRMMMECCKDCGCRLATWEEYWFYRLDQIINGTVDLGELLLESGSGPTWALLSKDGKHIALAGPGTDYTEQRNRGTNMHVIETSCSILFDNVLMFSNTIPLMVKLDEQHQTSETHQFTKSELKRKLNDLDKEIDELEKQEKECNAKKNKLIKEYNMFLDQYREI